MTWLRYLTYLAENQIDLLEYFFQEWDASCALKWKFCSGISFLVPYLNFSFRSHSKVFSSFFIASSCSSLTQEWDKITDIENNLYSQRSWEFWHVFSLLLEDFKPKQNWFNWPISSGRLCKFFIHLCFFLLPSHNSSAVIMIWLKLKHFISVAIGYLRM